MGTNVICQETTEWHTNTKHQSEISGNKILIKSRESMVNKKKGKNTWKNFNLRSSPWNVLNDYKQLFINTGKMNVVAYCGDIKRNFDL